MPKPTDYDILLNETGPDPVTLAVAPGDKITWTNNLGVAVELTLPDCVSPPDGTITIDAGVTSRKFNVNGSSESYAYSYLYSIGTEQTGTIDVS